MRAGNSNLHSSPTERPFTGVAGSVQRGVLATADYAAFGFGWCRDGEPQIDRTGLTPAEALSEFRHAWRRCNGSQWRWRMTFDGYEIDGNSDDLLEALDDLTVTRRGFVVGVTRRH